VSLNTFVFGLKMGVVLYGGILGTFVFGLKMRVGVKKKSKNDKKTQKKSKNASLFEQKAEKLKKK